MIGEEDIIQSRHYSTSVRAISQKTVVYRIKKADFLTWINKDPKVKSLVYNSCQQKTSALIQKVRNHITAVNYPEMPALNFHPSEKFRDRPKDTTRALNSNLSEFGFSSGRVSLRKKGDSHNNHDKVESVYKGVLEKHDIKPTVDMLVDFRSTLAKIVTVKKSFVSLSARKLPTCEPGIVKV